MQRHPGHHPRRDRHAARLGPIAGRAHRYGRRPTARTRRQRTGSRPVRHAALASGGVPRRRRDPGHRRRRGADRTGRPHRGLCRRGGQGPPCRREQWDLLLEKTDKTFDQYVDWIRKQAPFLDFAPVISITAKTGQRVDRVLEAAVDIWGERRKRVPTGELNRLISDAADRQTAPMVKGRRPKLFYATQVAVAPPTFVFFAREAGSVHFSYRRYLENRLREAFGFDGTPIRLVFRERSSVQLEKRRATKAAGRAPGRAQSGRGRRRRVKARVLGRVGEPHLVAGPRGRARQAVRAGSGASVGRGPEPPGQAGAASRSTRDADPERQAPQGPPGNALRRRRRPSSPARIAVIGTGAWGTTISALLGVARAGHAARTSAGQGGPTPDDTAQRREPARASTLPAVAPRDGRPDLARVGRSRHLSRCRRRICARSRPSPRRSSTDAPTCCPSSRASRAARCFG